ncbi:MAG: DUF2271 domain-containing protein [Treponema sp.]|nr:DUF2271 domain-containing protein [Treponema sp.]
MKSTASKLLLLVLFTGVGSALFAQENRVEVSFDFTRQGGIASNQFAVWVEDAQGRYVRTLYATRFTAASGWRRREGSLPQWVRQSGLAQRNQAQVDALTGPTPGTGTLRYVWDGMDYAGRAVPQGEYRLFVEASLRWDDRVLYTAVVRLGGAERAGTRRVNATARYFGTGTAERGMIGPVTVTF